ncbi:MAG: nucleotidyl transferase AbiEii/AbiGii toxin family protein [Bacteroidetes bacterium]|nr:nucleotidyl transferase AbiEii/AbiGii toxin family protein [Bacteroidota bacterium]
MLYKKVIPVDVFELAKKLLAVNELKKFRLSGGLSLSLQLGHRKAVDIDLFVDNVFDKVATKYALKKKFPDSSLAVEKFFGSVYIINGVKVHICRDNGKFIQPAITEDGLRLASIQDISAKKILSITEKPNKRDFVDLACLLEKLSLDDILKNYQKKYGFVDVRNVLLVLMKTYLVDEEQMPEMIDEISWTEVKEKLEAQVKEYLTQLKKAKKQEVEKRAKKKEIA